MYLASHMLLRPLGISAYVLKLLEELWRGNVRPAGDEGTKITLGIQLGFPKQVVQAAAVFLHFMGMEGGRLPVLGELANPVTENCLLWSPHSCRMTAPAFLANQAVQRLHWAALFEADLTVATP